MKKFFNLLLNLFTCPLPSADEVRASFAEKDFMEWAKADCKNSHTTIISCDFCECGFPLAQMHPEEAGAWVCDNCLNRWNSKELLDLHNNLENLHKRFLIIAKEKNAPHFAIAAEELKRTMENEPEF